MHYDTFPQMFAAALGTDINGGDARCFWCGCGCDESRRVSVGDTFWDWDVVAFPRSNFQCAGCTEALNEKRSLAGYDKPQKTRNHSWYVTSKPHVEPLNKATLARIREVCLSPPPDLDWGMAIAESGQKHVVFRTPINRAGSAAVRVQLETLAVSYSITGLRHAVSRCATLAQHIGKPCLGGPIEVGFAIRSMEAGIDPELIEQWNAEWNAPLWRLAAFLCPGKDDCGAYLAEVNPGSVPPPPGGTGRRTRVASLFD